MSLSRGYSVVIGECVLLARSGQRPADQLDGSRNPPFGDWSRRTSSRRDAGNSGRDDRAPHFYCIVTASTATRKFRYMIGRDLSNACLSLTPALSRWERESSLAAMSAIGAVFAAGCTATAQAVARFLSPSGRGVG